MKIQLSPIKIIPDALVVWQEPGPEVDIVMDLKNLTFKPESLEMIYMFHVLDHLFPKEILPALKNWHQCLIKGGTLFVVVDDFEYLMRAFIGGDLKIDDFNENFARPMNFSRESLAKILVNAGFQDQHNEITIWYEPSEFKRQHFELVLSALKS